MNLREIRSDDNDPALPGMSGHTGRDALVDGSPAAGCPWLNKSVLLTRFSTAAASVSESQFRSLGLPKPSRRVLVQQARDQRLIGKSFFERPLLDRLKILGRNPNVQ